jgi:hypothetical protein
MRSHLELCPYNWTRSDEFNILSASLSIIIGLLPSYFLIQHLSRDVTPLSRILASEASGLFIGLLGGRK